ncbi:uncharacterized protein LOC128200078 [Galleria mellonella]|uniref:Uncharacterized protein LOC128200078 n=1 Tax=Galleria mellonella TaxID=7137 RepID=A0ABM3M9P1_GALME|nr:uncharacterized protein LOC128200078 [Galleria mellonella]
MVDIVDYDSKCPTSCPASSMMMCEKCNHGIYRTFLSVCHMRLFHCKYKLIKLELVSRYPCMMSAPFLRNSPGMNLTPKGRLPEVEEDRILRFIHCRDRGLLSEKAGNLNKKTHFDKNYNFDDLRRKQR